jgi:hypothetical protein
MPGFPGKNRKLDDPGAERPRDRFWAPSRRARRQESRVTHDRASHDDLHTALRRLHRFHQGVLAIGERFERTGFVLDPATHRPVFPAPPGALEGEELTLFLPEDEPGALHVIGSPIELNPGRDEACDRFLIYFGKARWSRFAAVDVDHIKSTDIVVDGADATRENPLRLVEPRLCREINARPQQLVSLCQNRFSVSPVAPKLIGVDPYGIDIRLEFGPARIEFESVNESEDQVRHAIELLLAGA